MGTTARTPAELFPPGEFLQEELEARGWSQVDLADILGKDAKSVNEVIQGRRRISPDMARLLGQALGTSAELWMNIESAYQLYEAERAHPMANDVARRAQLYQEYPVREMIRRGWIDRTDNVDVLETQLKSFFSPSLAYAARKRNDESKAPLQKAWVYRVRQIAQRMQVEPYSETKLMWALGELKPLLFAAEEIRKVPEILRKAGVRFLAIEALPSSKIDGACLWLNAKSPVIAVSLRYDRIDNFWFTLMHELHHVKCGHGKKSAILDIDVMEDGDVTEEERLANEGATEFLIPEAEMDNFIARVKPLFNTNQIRGFSKRMGVHMGVAVGQLQHRKLIGFDRNRAALVKVRKIITETSTCDGWGMIA